MTEGNGTHRPGDHSDAATPQTTVAGVPSPHAGTGHRRRVRRFSRSYAAALVTLFGLLVTVLVYLRVRTVPTPAFDQSLLPAPARGPETHVVLMLASDSDGGLTPTPATIPLPLPPAARACALLNALFRIYAQSASAHPIAPSAAVESVTLHPLPTRSGYPQGDLAVVDLSPALAAVHPSGIEPETLTILSILATLYTNMPRIAGIHVAEVRFLVGGHPRATLAGHADLSRTYLASSAAPASEGAPEPAHSQTEANPDSGRPRSGARP